MKLLPAGITPLEGADTIGELIEIDIVQVAKHLRPIQPRAEHGTGHIVAGCVFRRRDTAPYSRRERNTHDITYTMSWPVCQATVRRDNLSIHPLR